MSLVAVIFCSILTVMVGLLSCWGFHPRSRSARVSVLCGFTAFLLALLGTSFNKFWISQMRSETAVVTEVGDRVMGTAGGHEVILESDRPLVVGQELSILVDNDDGQARGYAADDQGPSYFRALLFALASAALFTWGVFRLRHLGKDPDPAAEASGVGLSRG